MAQLLPWCPAAIPEANKGLGSDEEMQAQATDAMKQLLPWRPAAIVEAYKGLGSSH